MRRKLKNMLSKMKIIIIDGYNVLRNNAKYAEAVGYAPDFKDWTSETLNAAREALLNDVCQLVEKNTRAIIVYDAANRQGKKNYNENIYSPNNIQIIFTNKGESADSRIQKLVYMYRQKGQEVEVITSDLAIQDATINKGVVRTSARAFEEELRDSKPSPEKKAPGLGKIEDIVDKKTSEKLRALRDSLN